MTLQRARIAGYHEDKRGFTNILVDGGVSSVLLHEAFREGELMKIGGIACDCHRCTGSRVRGPTCREMVAEIEAAAMPVQIGLGV